MSRKTLDMTTGSLWGKIFLFSVPLMISNVLQVLFNMADIAVVGHFCGPEALGSVGSTSILVSLFTGFMIGMGSGVNTVIARYLGARSHKDVSETAHTSLGICLMVGCVIMLLGVFGARGLLKLLNTKQELIDGAVLYLRIYLLGSPAMGIFNFGNGVLSAAGNTRRPLIFLTLAGIINVLLNFFFVIACHMAVAGVALSSVVSQYISAALILISLFRDDAPYALRLHSLHIDGKKARAVLGLGLPAGMQNAIFQMANLFIQTGVNSFDAVVVEGNSAASNSDGLVYDIMAAFYVACTSFMGQNLGARKRERILKSYLISLAYSFGAGAILGISLAIFGRQFLSIFTPDASVVQAGMARLTVMGLSYAVSAFMDATIAASRGLGKSVVPTLIVFMGSCVLRIIWVYTVFAYFGTIMSLYCVYVFTWTVTAIAEIIYFVRIYRREMAAWDAI